MVVLLSTNRLAMICRIELTATSVLCKPATTSPLDRGVGDTGTASELEAVTCAVAELCGALVDIALARGESVIFAAGFEPRFSKAFITSR